MELDKTMETLKEQFEHHRMMMFKALGAIEVLEDLANKNEEEKDK